MMDETELIDRIYECSLLPELWPDVLSSLSQNADAYGGYVFAANPQLLNWTASDSIREMFASAVQSGAFARSPRIAQMIMLNRAGFVRNTDFIKDDEMAKDGIYSDYLWPRGLGPCAATLARLPTEDMLVIAVEGKRANGPISPKGVSMLDAMRPHIVRSAFLSARLQLERAKVASDTLALLGLPAFVFDSRGKVLVANDLTDSLGLHIRWRTQDRISLKDAAADVLLQQALDPRNAHATGCVRSFATRRTEDAPGMIVHAVPMRGAARDLFAQCAAIVVFTPVTMPKAPAVDLIQSLFDLTPAEARVARSLVSGKTVDELAARSGVSPNTLKTQIRAVLDKSGCGGRTEFVAMLSSAPKIDKQR